MYASSTASCDSRRAAPCHPKGKLSTAGILFERESFPLSPPAGRARSPLRDGDSGIPPHEQPCSHHRGSAVGELSCQELRHATRTGEPPGGDEFVKRPEAETGRNLRVRSRGRPQRKCVRPSFFTAWPVRGASISAMVWPVIGSRSAGFSSASGARVNRRSRYRGCGISSSSVFITVLP